MRQIDWDVALCLPFPQPWIVNNATSKALDGTHVEKALQFWPHFVLLTKRGPSLMTALCFGRAPRCCRARSRLSLERLSTSSVELLPKPDTRTAGPFFLCMEKEQEEQFNNSHKNVSQSTQTSVGGVWIGEGACKGGEKTHKVREEKQTRDYSLPSIGR